MDQRRDYVSSMIIIGALYFIFGFVTWLNGTLIPYLKIACELESDLQSFLVITAFFIAYTIMALPASLVLKKTGYKRGMALGLFVMAAGAALFIPAANSRSFNLFLIGLFIIGSGLALLQTAANPYVSIIGPIESAAKRISIMGICNKVAGIIAGLIFGFIALNDVDSLVERLKTMSLADRALQLDELASRVIVPYIVITLVLLALGFWILKSSLPEIADDSESETGAHLPAGKKTSVFQFPHLLLGILCIFLYVGVEVMAGDTIITYGQSLDIPLSTARFFTNGTLACMLLGYFIGTFAIPKYLSQQTGLKICALLGVVFTLGAVFTTGMVSVGFIAALGLANSLMWPAIFPLAIDGLGKFTKTGSALLVMGISGGAVLPLIYAWVAELIGSKGEAYAIMVPAYLIILYFATSGYKLGKTIR